MATESKWGDTRANQLEACKWGKREKEVEVSELRLFGCVIRKAGKRKVSVECKLSTKEGDHIGDDEEVKRTFKYRCGLIKVICGFSRGYSMMILFLDGWDNMGLSVGETEIRFDEQLVGDPVVDLVFYGDCTRYGKMDYCRLSSVVLVFKDKKQFDQYVTTPAATDHA
jgi:hypothetical protein